MIEFILFVFGFVCHQSKRYTKDIPGGFQQLTEYVIGAAMIYAALQFIFRVGHKESFTSQYARAVLPMGLGVAVGWATDDILENVKE